MFVEELAECAIQDESIIVDRVLKMKSDFLHFIVCELNKKPVKLIEEDVFTMATAKVHEEQVIWML